MSRAKTIDRLELTRRSSKHLRQRDTPPEGQEHGGICPKCHQHTLHFMEGCATCVACGYSACGLDN
ncbi:MAG: hypothetical protein IJG37_06475 [Synergistaceae bacterium]|nr:hypothetical protein [Synergistaceae bacterium]